MCERVTDTHEQTTKRPNDQTHARARAARCGARQGMGAMLCLRKVGGAQHDAEHHLDDAHDDGHLHLERVVELQAVRGVPAAAAPAV